jgi:hypothetical protein
LCDRSKIIDRDQIQSEVVVVVVVVVVVITGVVVVLGK